MLIVERNENGRTVVRLHKDWHIGRMGSAYTPPKQNFVVGDDACKLQSALLRSSHAKRKAYERRVAISQMER